MGHKGAVGQLGRGLGVRGALGRTEQARPPPQGWAPFWVAFSGLVPILGGPISAVAPSGRWRRPTTG